MSFRQEATLNIDFTINTGRGYQPAQKNKPEDASIGLIPIDAIFSPIKTVSYKIENARVGQDTDYDKLLLDIETDGTITQEPRLYLQEF